MGIAIIVCLNDLVVEWVGGGAFYIALNYPDSHDYETRCPHSVLVLTLSVPAALLSDKQYVLSEVSRRIVLALSDFKTKRHRRPIVFISPVEMAEY